MDAPTNTPTPDHLSRVHGYNDEVHESPPTASVDETEAMRQALEFAGI